MHNVVKTICHKIEENKPIDKEDRSILNSNIPYFNKKIGDIENYEIKFVYTTINPLTNNYQFQLLLLDILYHLKVIPKLDDIKKGVSLYAFPRITDISYHFRLIDYIFFV